MQTLAATLLEQARAYSLPEVTAVVLAIGYVVLAIRQNIWCWLCAGLSTAIFAWVFFEVHLYMEAGLNVFYFLMAIYGGWSWRTGGAGIDDMPVVVWSPHVHIAAITGVLVLTAGSGYALANHTSAAFPYLDSLTSWAAVWATFLVARKVLENWWYWLVIDATMVYVFWVKELQFTAILYVVYLCLIPIGLLSWRRSWREVQT